MTTINVDIMKLLITIAEMNQEGSILYRVGMKDGAAYAAHPSCMMTVHPDSIPSQADFLVFGLKPLDWKELLGGQTFFDLPVSELEGVKPAKWIRYCDDGKTFKTKGFYVYQDAPISHQYRCFDGEKFSKVIDIAVKAAKILGLSTIRLSTLAKDTPPDEIYGKNTPLIIDIGERVRLVMMTYYIDEKIIRRKFYLDHSPVDKSWDGFLSALGHELSKGGLPKKYSNVDDFLLDVERSMNGQPDVIFEWSSAPFKAAGKMIGIKQHITKLTLSKLKEGKLCPLKREMVQAAKALQA